jgi:hypothetical protein
MISKQEFYEGAALHQLSSERPITIGQSPPFFIFDGRLWALLKYCTKGRSPWNFTFTVDEQRQIVERSTASELILGLICGDDGIVTLAAADYLTVAPVRETALHIACFRQHKEQYEIRGPDGKLTGKVPPSRWKQLLKETNI